MPKNAGTAHRPTGYNALNHRDPRKMARYILTFASLNGFLVVALGAFGAHALETIVDAKAMGVFETGVQYHLFHTLALFGNGLLAGQYPAQKLFWIPASLFATGIVLFAGSLYLLGMTGLSWLGPSRRLEVWVFSAVGQALPGFVCRQTCDRGSRHNDNSDNRKRQN